jgi:hypothetical protein
MIDFPRKSKIPTLSTFFKTSQALLPCHYKISKKIPQVLTHHPPNQEGVGHFIIFGPFYLALHKVSCNNLQPAFLSWAATQISHITKMLLQQANCLPLFMNQILPTHLSLGLLGNLCGAHFLPRILLQLAQVGPF